MEQIKAHIEKKNHDRYFHRVLNFARAEQNELYEKDNSAQKAREEQFKQEEKLAAELSRLKTEEIRSLKMRYLMNNYDHIYEMFIKYF